MNDCISVYQSIIIFNIMTFQSILSDGVYGCVVDTIKQYPLDSHRRGILHFTMTTKLLKAILEMQLFWECI